MNPVDLFIERPILTWMLTLSLVVFGVLGYARLGVDQFPAMEYPVVYVSTLLEGASPEVVEKDVTDVLEEQLGSISGVRSLRSTSSHGASSIRVEFELGRDIDAAAQDVRDRVARARRELPRDVEAPLVDKQDLGRSAVVWVPVQSDRPVVETSEYVRQVLRPKFESISGVAFAQVWGRRDRAIRIWLDGREMRARGVAVGDILDALAREHVEVPGGRVQSRHIEYAVQTSAEFRSVAELEGMVVRWQDGAPVTLRDLARVEDGAADLASIGHYNGVPTVALGIHRLSGANTVEVVDAVYREVEALRPQLPTGMHFIMGGDGTADFSRPIREAVEETLFALVFGALLATLTVFVFLRRTRPTLIVGVAIPISLVATFGVMWALGFTLNTMTLLAMALAVGVVIDDAIVVLENIERHREGGEAPRVAASRGTREIAFAATAATVSIAVVFLPVVFVSGVVGSFLSEFGATVASSVMISLVVALTLTPMLAARMAPPRERVHGGVYHRLERGFAGLERGYRGFLGLALEHRALTLGVAVASLLLAVFFGSQLGQEFFPPTDNGLVLVTFETPQGTRLEVTGEYLDLNDRWMLERPEVAGIFSGVGSDADGRGARALNNGMMFVMLRSKRERELTTQQLVPVARAALNRFPGQNAKVFDMSNLMSEGLYAFGFEIRGDADLEEFDRVSGEFVQALEARGGYVDLDQSLKLGLPEVRVEPDRRKAAALGVDARSVATAIQAMVGGMDVAKFKEAGQRYDIRVRLEEQDRNAPESIGQLSVRGRDGEPIELRNLVEIRTGAAPSEITRTDRQRSVRIEGNLEGKPLGAAMDEVREIADRILPDGMNLVMAGEARKMSEGAADFGLAIALGVLVIYMVLAAQFESLTHPLTVMLALPLAMVGALGALYAAGMTLNVFSLIGIILLMGLVTKNSILVVDYANQLRAKGQSKLDAIRTAAPIRMRPVLMTALSMIFAVLPAALGVGPGAETRAPMAVAVAAGMFSSTLLTLIVVPVFYVVLDDLVEGVGRRIRRGRSRLAAASGGRMID